MGSMRSLGETSWSLKTYEFIIYDPFWLDGALRNMLTSMLPNLHFGKRVGAQDMIIFGLHVGPHIPNAGLFTNLY